MIVKLQELMEYEIQILGTRCFGIMFIEYIKKPGFWKDSFVSG